MQALQLLFARARDTHVANSVNSGHRVNRANRANRVCRKDSANRRYPMLAALIATVVCMSLSASVLQAQTLSPKRTLTTGAAPGCDLAPPISNADAPRNNAEARRLASVAQEAALEGNQEAARDAFVQAARLNPSDDRLAYDLGRAHEELSDTLPAIGAFCRYLVLAPAGTESADVRARLLRLVPNDARQRADESLVAFNLGLEFLDAGANAAAVRAFDEVVRLAPAAPEGHFNRGLARSAVGERAAALTDLEVYRAAAPSVEERVATARAIDVLRRPVYSPGAAFARGIVPGFGQFYTARPVRGVVVLSAVAGAAAAAFAQQTTERTINYVDPNGVPAPYTESFTERRYLTAGLAAAAGVTVLAALEAVWYANRSQRGASILAGDAARSASSGLDASLAPYLPSMGGGGLQLRFSF